MGKRPSLLLKNVLVPGGRIADIAIRDGVVGHLGAGETADQTIDCTGYLIMPGGVDIHVHMRDGPQSAKEDWETGSRSALAGGITTVVDQPNTQPPLTTPEVFTARVQEATKSSLCNFAINSGVTPDTPLRAMWEAGAMAFGETFFAPSSYGEAIGREDLSRALAHISELGGLATIHAEEVATGQDNDLAAHDVLRSPEGEIRAVKAVQECNRNACRLHFCHMSTAGSIDAATGTVEVTPHHLFLSYEQAVRDDAIYKVNPPLRCEIERKNLWTRWNRINVIASDHAPHTLIEKKRSFASAPSGMPGVETMIPLLLAEVLAKRISLPDLIMKTSQTPAWLMGIPAGGFTPGNRGDFALYPKFAEPLHAENLHSKCGWTPYEGRMAVFPEIVILGGDIVFQNGDFFPGRPAWMSGNGYLEP